jgi:hypothetical protein
VTFGAILGGLGPVAAFAAPSSFPALSAVGGEPDPTNAVQKYYVVGPPADGQREFLFDIAARTLGDGYRYREIFDLNIGRIQPDGKRLLNPAVIEPGWILLLPPDASGPSVHSGVPPFVPPSAGVADAGATTRGHETAAGEPVAAAIRLGVIAVVVGLVLLVAVRWRREPRPAARPAVGAPPCVAEPARISPLAAFSAYVARDGELVRVRLLGGRDPLGVPYRWSHVPEPGPFESGATVFVGRDDPGYLLVDLAATPDVVTVTGDADARARLVASFANQILDHGVSQVAVTIVGDIVDRRQLSVSAQYAADVGELLSSGLERTRRCTVVICAVGHEDELDVLRELVRRTDHRVVPVVVGDLPPARWSFEATTRAYVRVATEANGTVSTTPSGPVTAKKARSPRAAGTSP